MNSVDIINYTRPKLGASQAQYDALLRVLNSGAKIDDLAIFLGMTLNVDVPKVEDKPNVSTSKYTLSRRSIDNIKDIDQSLAKVVRRAIEITTQDFVVTDGMRDREGMMVNYGKGRTAAQLAVHGIPAKYAKPNERQVTWLNNPFASKHAQGKAVDIYPYPVGDINNVPIEKQSAIGKAMLDAAKELGVNVTWGKTFKKVDMPHFEIP